MATKDKMQTTAGSNALIGSIVPKDAHVVKLLRDAGAIIIGHASMSEWASIRSSEESMGYSARGGQARNPYILSMSAWGSSSGSAAAVAAGIVPISYGTETDTSIISPAYYTGLVGIKPTVGLTSRSGVIPCSKSQDTVGPFARNVRDAVYGLQAIVGDDGCDGDVLQREEREKHNIKDYASYLSTKDALKGAVFGLPIKRVWDNVDEALRPRYEEVFQMIKDAGAQIVQVDFPCWLVCQASLLIPRLSAVN
jgi:amidase